MAHLMAYHDADAAVVHGIVGIRIEERRLQDGRWKHDLVVERVVVGIDVAHLHLPFVPVDGFVEARQLPMPLPQIRALGIAEGIAAHDLECAVILPPVGIADLRA